MSLDSVSFIQGVAVGLEYVDAIPEEKIPNSIVLDLIFLRLIFSV